MNSAYAHGAWRGRLLARIAAVAAASVLGVGWMVATGPSSSASGTNATSSAAPKPKPWTPPAKKATGSPLTVMTSAAIDYNGPTYPNIEATAKLAGDWINAHGGVKGHRLIVNTCDTRGTPSVTAECGRQAISDKVVAYVGSFTISGNSIIPELTAAHISWFGICCPVSTDEWKDPNVQSIGNVEAGLVGIVVKMVADGCKHIGIIDSLTTKTGDAFEQKEVDNALKSIGAPLSDVAKWVGVPLAVETEAPEIANLTTGTDCLYPGISESNYQEFFPPYVQSGAHQRLYGYQGNFDIVSVKAFPKVTQTGVIAGVYTTIKEPAWKNFRAAIKQYHGTPKLNYNSLAGLGTWEAYMAFQQVADSLKGPINNVTFLAAAQKATIDLPGGPPADFAHKFHGLTGVFLNQVNWDVTWDVVHTGKLCPFDHGKFFTMENAVLGKKLPKVDIPPKGQKGTTCSATTS